MTVEDRHGTFTFVTDNLSLKMESTFTTRAGI